MAPAAAPSSTAFGSTQASPFSTPVAPMPSSSNTSAFGSTATGGAPSPSPFGASASQPSSIGQSPFGKPAASPFGSTPSPFGPPATSQASPFGQPVAPQPAAAPTPSTTLIGGREPREVLVAFYQKYNQSRLGEVDKVLLKYKGNEEQLFRNLARKYNLDPTIFGLSPTPPASAVPFGQPSTSGGFGQTSQPFGTPSTPGFGQTSSLGGGSVSLWFTFSSTSIRFSICNRRRSVYFWVHGTTAWNTANNSFWWKWNAAGRWVWFTVFWLYLWLWRRRGIWRWSCS